MSDDVPEPKRIWPWLTASAIAVLLLALAALLALGVFGPTSTPGGSRTPESTPSTTSATPAVPSEEPSAELEEVARVAVNAGDLDALAAHMTDPVTFIIAASEGLGDIAPEGAVDALAYTAEAELPWDFDLPMATLEAYRSHFYGPYFPEGALVGRSMDGQVISFTITDGAISRIFVAGSEDILLQD